MVPTEKVKRLTRTKRVGLKDVALEAGVDVSTVSRILGGSASLYAEDTCTKVQDAARALNYRPNAAARGMATGSTRMVGVTVPGTEFCGSIVEGINETLLQHGHLMLHAWNPETFVASDDPMQRKIIHELVERQVDGVILRVGSEEFEHTYFEELWQRGIPMIVVDREMALFKTDFVGTDDVAIGADAARHLLGLGHRRLLFIGEKETVSTCRLREKGFRDVVSEAPNAACKKLELDLKTAVAEDLIAVLEGDGRPTGVFCYSDRMVPLFYEAARKLALDIPSDISVVGCGNLSWGKMLTPALSTFDQHPEGIGRMAAELYLERVSEGQQERSVPKVVRVSADLLERASTARA